MRTLEVLKCVCTISDAGVSRAERIKVDWRLVILWRQRALDLLDGLIVFLLVNQNAAEMKASERIIRTIINGRPKFFLRV